MSEKQSLLAELQNRDPVLLKILENVNRVFGKRQRTIKLVDGDNAGGDL